ncbi:hypothetical protein CVT25_009070 [Psilocybe cyanescens]|uniref:Uncharacterized protein n=1 Tax=Psilocybe cyanescens TaxID=93625 RepID=A0A409XGN4_PSICY|nr:hypothetical protein CVT25_009070 [Psilocybe cyanescens]
MTFSSNSMSFARALSPSLDALTQAVVANTVSGKTNDATTDLFRDELVTVLMKKIAECRSVDNVIDCVYQDYRLALREPLLNIASWCDKKHSVKTSYDRLVTTLTANDVPNRLRVKAPEFQLTKEFSESGSADALAAKQAFESATKTFQSSINDTVLATKKAELAFWGEKCGTDSMYEALTKVTTEVWNDRKRGYRMPVIVRDDNGTNRIDRWEVSPQKKSERDALSVCLPLICNQIDNIVEIRHRALNKKIEKKRDTAAKADVEMADATKPGPSIQSLIDKGLNARLKKLNLVPAGKKALITQTSSGQNSSKAPQPKASGSKPKSSNPSSNSKPATKANTKVDNKKKGKGKAPVKVDHKGKGKAKA